MESMERKNSRIHSETLRLNRFLAMAGIASRRKSEELIRSGVVRLNGKVVTELSTKVDPENDKVTVQGKPIALVEKKIYILMNKPKDAITTMSDEKGRTTVMDFLKTKYRVFPIGRLDRNTTGVLLFTNDGDFANALLHPRYEIEKMYRVTLDKQITDVDLKKLRKGIQLEDGIARGKMVEVIEGSKRKKVLLTICEGRNREVRRMFEALGYDVRQLDRVSFAGLTPLGVPRGKWRFLTQGEIRQLKELIGLTQ